MESPWKRAIIEVAKNILTVDVNDGIEFEFKSIEPIREDDAYNNFRAHLLAHYGKINASMKIDITTGDIITPVAIRYDYPLFFEEKNVSVMAYTIETVLAEKYETIIRRNIGTTRARDFYDLHMLYRLYKEKINREYLRLAVLHTAKKRGSLEEIKDWRDILHDIREEQHLYSLWNNYAEENSYAKEWSFSDVLDTTEKFAQDLGSMVWY